MEPVNNPVLRKYHDLRERGRFAYASDSIAAFAGFGANLRRRLNLSFPFGSARSRAQEIRETLADTPLELIWAGHEFPLHATVLEAEATSDLDPWLEDETWSDLQTGARTLLTGMTVAFDQLIADPSGAVILAARTIPDEILGVRLATQAIYRRQGLKPLPLDHILHSSQVRITRLPEELLERTGALRDFHAKIEALNADLERRPIEVTVLSVQLRQVYHFLNGHV